MDQSGDKKHCQAGQKRAEARDGHSLRHGSIFFWGGGATGGVDRNGYQNMPDLDAISEG